ncbi:HPr family phosphocarrier protein [Shigella flexneri]
MAGRYRALLSCKQKTVPGERAMALIVEFICQLPNGVSARPASHVETLCNTFSSQIEWHNLRTDRKGNAKAPLRSIGTDTLAGDNCQLLIAGADEQEAHQRFSQWLRDEFPRCDTPLAEVNADKLEPLPVSLPDLNPQILRAAPCAAVVQAAF